MQNINLSKYIIGTILIWFFWAFVGGLIIANFDNSSGKNISLGATTFFIGGLLSYFIYSYLLKKGKIRWFLKNGADNT